MSAGICLANLFRPRPRIHFRIGIARSEKTLPPRAQRRGAPLGAADYGGHPPNHAAPSGSEPPERGYRIRDGGQDIPPIRSAQVDLRSSLSFDWTGRPPEAARNGFACGQTHPAHWRCPEGVRIRSSIARNGWCAIFLSHIASALNGAG